MEYKFFQIQDFIKDDAFIRWVKYGENDAFFQAFILDNPEKQTIISKASDFIKKVAEAEKLRQPDISQLKVWTAITANIDNDSESSKPSLFSKLYATKWAKISWAAAACLVIGIGLKGFLSNNNPKKISYSELVATAEKQIQLIEKVNKSNTQLSLKLEDGSVVTLEKNAKLSYPKHFEPNKRQVFLSGEAFFDITKNPKKPFFVYSNEVITKVLGTSFTIQAFEDAPEVIVSVKTGRVSVFHQNKIALADPEEKALIITPNQQIVFSRKAESLTKSLVESPLLIKDLSQLPEQSFEDKPVSEVLKAIEQAYGVHIIYDADQLSNCIITTTLANESLYSKLDIMCKTIGASYKIVDAQIVIQSMGCN
ncbi:FecR family protein [Emticicia sediminis]